ncbi:hypothetical protein J5N97_010703 [Dioscorea zingiberensis]|uniref:NADP-dependent oxidoreductase domain-containing protein n=1 Tax=Dioscorea zingiberensis TaxID=325984 RepID=A0A9D5D1N8_9LILI|nr:hypothetical protein J5N97_010703 [Dioscorea zingiberensis]
MTGSEKENENELPRQNRFSPIEFGEEQHMDIQENFFKEQMMKIHKMTEEKEKKFEQLFQVEREKAKQADIESGTNEERIHRKEEIARFIDKQIKGVEEFEDEREELIHAHKVKKLELKKRQMMEEVELEKEFDAALTRLMQKFTPSKFQVSGRELGIGIVAYSPLGRGFFGGKGVIESLPENIHLARHPRFIGENLEKNKTLYVRVENLAKKHQCSPAQLALTWILHKGNDVVPIPGTTKIKNLDGNIGALQVKLTEEDMKEISDLVSEVEVAGSRNFVTTDKFDWKYANTPLPKSA